MEKDAKIFVAGHRGLVGGAVVRRLTAGGFENLVLRDHASLDLTDTAAVEAFFEGAGVDYVFLCAAKVGGILANKTRPADFIRENLRIQTNVIDAAWRHGVRKLLFPASSCVYPVDARQPTAESCYLTGPLEPNVAAYGFAKIAGIETCRAYRRQHGFEAITCVPCNLYGPGDNFDPEGSHALAGMMLKLHAAKVRGEDRVTLWGSGAPTREFLHCDDLADALVFLMARYDSDEIINVGAGRDVRIRDLAEMVRAAVGFEGRLEWDTDKPDGAPRKLFDVTRLSALGWRAGRDLGAGIRETYAWYLANCAKV
jgi:GDP-L-fucose synthase